MKLLFSAGIVVYFKRKDKLQYLLLHYEAGHWGFPKGKIEGDEDKKETALRELKEEASLLATIHDGFEHYFEYFFKEKDGDLAKKTAYFFVGRTRSKKVQLSNEHVGFKWLEYEQALEKLTYDNARKLLEKANKFLLKNYL